MLEGKLIAITLLVYSIHAWALNDVTECISSTEAVADRSLLQTGSLRDRLGQDAAPALKPRQDAAPDAAPPLKSLQDAAPASKPRQDAAPALKPRQPGVEDVDIGPFGVATIPESLLEGMVKPVYKCDFTSPPHAPDSLCDMSLEEAGLHPAHLTLAGNQTAYRAHALRLHLPLGSLPCCDTQPFCAAPKCDQSVLTAVPQTCSKRSGPSNFAYMTHQQVWPAYHGIGGAFAIDVQKHWDVLGRLEYIQPHLPPFDLAIDLGANWGLMTESLVERRFAKDYILVEADPGLKGVFDSRFGNADFAHRFSSEMAATWPDAEVLDPHFEFHTFAISDHSGGYLDTCSFNPLTPDMSCKSEVSTVDDIIPGRLSPDFADRFAKAQSVYFKLDVEGMDQMALNGMQRLLSEQRGNNYLVNFFMLEFCSQCMESVREMNKFEEYDLKTLAATLEGLGFEAFLIGPRYLPLTHGSWDDLFSDFSKKPENADCDRANYPRFTDLWPEGGKCAGWTGDIFAMRASHPKSTEIKFALGACEESVDFNARDPQYDLQ
mmetsp:Transcript_77292/g.145752  ORF Transcript_77292/g.145752 Transcript_77292/m.145752 type:complete len:546 (-) Transcript_77292:30-1667(-)